MTSLTKEQVMAKLEKLLTLAGNKGATEAEMHTAMAKATTLAREHNIDMASVSASGEVKVDEIETDWAETFTKTKQEQPYHMPIIQVIWQVFGCKPMVATYTDHNSMRHITRITWIGESTDLAMAVYCWGWLETLFPKCWLDYRKANHIADNYISRRSYFFGLRDGIISANKRATESLSPDQQNKYALVVANKAQLVEARYAERFPKTDKMKSFQTQGDSHTRAAGYAKGTSIKLNGGIAAGQSRTALN